jgi:hypothetical protein
MEKLEALYAACNGLLVEDASLDSNALRPESLNRIKQLGFLIDTETSGTIEADMIPSYPSQGGY